MTESIISQIDKKLAKAEELSELGIFHEEYKLYKEVLRLDENNTTALINISDCLIKMNLNNDALYYSEKAYRLRQSLEDDVATVNYSCVLIVMKHYEKAIEILENERALGSENHLIYNNLGWIYYLTEQYIKALDNFNLSIELEEINELAYCNRGRLNYFIFSDDSGIEDLKKAYRYGDIEAGNILQKLRDEEYHMQKFN